jgi:hypothetical protein
LDGANDNDNKKAWASLLWFFHWGQTKHDTDIKRDKDLGGGGELRIQKQTEQGILGTYGNHNRQGDGVKQGHFVHTLITEEKCWCKQEHIYKYCTWTVLVPGARHLIYTCTWVLH